MNIFQKALNAIRHPGRPPLFGALLKRTKFDYRSEVGDGLDSSVVTAPALWLARALPEAKLAITRENRDGGTDDVPDHPLIQLVQNPNPFYGDIALWMATVIVFAITGNAYWLIVRNGVGRPAELWFVPPWLMEPKYPAGGEVFISHYRYSPGGGAEPVNIDPDDVIHFRYGINPRNIRLGLSPIDGVIREIFVDLESSNFVASLLRNMGVPGVVISPKGGAMPAPADVEATKAWFKEAFGGDRRGGPLVMGAPTDVSPYGFNPQQLNMSEGRDVSEERVCACLGVPAAVVGFGAGLQQTKVGATMEELRKLAWHNGVLPVARMMVDELRRSLLPAFGKSTGLTLDWDVSDVKALQEDEAKRTERLLKEFSGGAMDLFEYRTEMGRDADDSHRIYLRPIAMIEVPSAELGKPRPEEEPPAKSGGTKEQKTRATPAAYRRGAAFALALQRLAIGQEKAFAKRLETVFGGWRKEAVAAAKPLLATDPTIAAESGGKAKKPARGEKADEALVAQILQSLGIAEWRKQLRQAFESQYIEVAEAVAKVAEEAGLGTGLPDPVARAIVAAGGRRSGLVDIEEQSRAAIFDALAEGRAAGEGADALAGRIADEIEGGHWDSPEIRARIIARTETKYAQNISTLKRGGASGIEKFIVFDGRLGPGRSKPSHIDRDGSIVDGATAEDMAEAEHPNGTLSFSPYFDLDEED